MKRMKTLFSVILLVSLLCMFAGCDSVNKQFREYEKYTFQFFGVFDTVVQVIGYAKSDKEFNEYTEYAQTCLNAMV